MTRTPLLLALAASAALAGCNKENQTIIAGPDGIEDNNGAAEENLAKLNAFVMAYPAEKLGDTVPMPMWPGGQMPVVEALQIHNWNVSYHTGQINYIQTLYGDGSM